MADRFRRRGKLFVVSAPSGAGKTSLCREMLKRLSGIEYSISYTTRPPRPTEQNGRDYFFVSEVEFKKMIDRNEFVEWAKVHENLYGTHAGYLNRAVSEGRDVILDVDAQGAASLKTRVPEGVFIYILPPSLESLRERLLSRGADPPDVIERRLNRARDEMNQFTNYSHLIVNDSFETAADQLRAVIVATRIRLDGIDVDLVRRRFLGEPDGAENAKEKEKF